MLFPSKEKTMASEEALISYKGRQLIEHELLGHLSTRTLEDSFAGINTVHLREAKVWEVPIFRIYITEVLVVTDWYH